MGNQFNAWEPTLSGLEGNMQAQPRLFAHDAKLIIIGAINNSQYNSGLNVTNFGTGYIVGELITVTTPSGTGGTVGDRAVVKVLTISGAAATGPVLTYEMSTVGAKYLVGGTANQESTNGAGSGFEATVSNIDIPNTQQRGCCLYIGDVAGGAALQVIMESTAFTGTAGTGYGVLDFVEFSGVLTGGIYPYLVKQVVYNAATPTKIIALY